MRARQLTRVALLVELLDKDIVTMIKGEHTVEEGGYRKQDAAKTTHVTEDVKVGVDCAAKIMLVHAQRIVKSQTMASVLCACVSIVVFEREVFLSNASQAGKRNSKEIFAAKFSHLVLLHTNKPRRRPPEEVHDRVLKDRRF